MAKKSKASLNELLVSLFNSIMDTQAKAVITEEFKDMTDNEMHILEAVGTNDNNPHKVSDIAKRLGVTAGTLTVNMNNLQKKGYINRDRSTSDKRVVLVTLTDRGKKAFYHHRDFHRHMIKEVSSCFSEDEKMILLSCLTRLEDFFKNYHQYCD